MITSLNRLRLMPMYFGIALLSLFTGQGRIVAQAPTTVEVEIHSATANLITSNNKVTAWSIFVTFTKTFDQNTDGKYAESPGNYRVINANTSAQVPISEAAFVHTTGAAITTVRLTLASADALTKGETFYLLALHLTFHGLPSESTPMHEIKIQSDPSGIKVAQVDNSGTDGAGLNAHKLPKPAWGLKKSKGRDDSNLYGSYELTQARGVATTGTGDFKIAIPFVRDFWNRRSTFSPLIDFKASSDENADPDSIKFAFEWFLPLRVPDDPNSQKLFEDIDWINAGKIEAPKNFDNINALWESKLLFPSAQIPAGSKKFRMFVTPFAGVEVGKNLKSPLPDLEGKGLARAMVGGDLTIQIPIENLVALKGFEFNSSYIRRWPLIRELLSQKDDAGNLVALAESKGPKDYSDSKFIIKINDYFGPYVGYEWGRLPPNYELVDHKWIFGILFKAKIKAK